MTKLGTISYVNETSDVGFVVAKRGTMTLLPGISPSSATIVTVPQPGILPDTGVLKFDFLDAQTATNVTIEFLEAAVTQASLRLDGGAYVWSIQILDRRWKWRFGSINGEYNKRLKDGSIDTTTEKTPQELAALLFTAMGEDAPGGTYPPDATLLPNDSRPYVNWDHVNPARELGTLCEGLGCIVTLQLDNTVKIYPLETGNKLSQTDAASYATSILYKIAPEELKIVGAPIEFQSRLVLEAVGLDTDDEIKLLADLSYSPLDFAEDHEHFSGIVDETERRLASSTVFRWYRVKEQLGGGTELPGGIETLNSMKQIKLLSGLIQEQTNYGTDKKRKKPRAMGDFFSLDVFGTDTEGVYTGKFTVDTTNNLIKFPKPVRKIDNGTNQPADMVVEIAYTAIGNDGAPLRYERERDNPGIDHTTEPKIIKRDDIQRTIRVTYDSSIPGTELSEVDNETDVDAEADYYLDAEEETYNIQDADSVTYGGLVARNVDGLVKSVSWKIGDGPTMTAASADGRSNPYIPHYDTKRALEKQQDQEDRTREMFARIARQNEERAELDSI